LVGSNAWDKALQDGVSGTPSSTLMASILMELLFNQH
jgi:hypothetical protein